MKFIQHLITTAVFWFVLIEYTKASNCSSRKYINLTNLIHCLPQTGRKPGARVLIPTGYLHPGKGKH
jgi:hypothetical protein